MARYSSKKKSSSRKGGRKGGRKANPYAGLTRKQLVARLQRLSGGKKAGGRKGGRKGRRGLTYRQKVKYGMASALPKDYFDKLQKRRVAEAYASHQAAGHNAYNPFRHDPRRGKKGKKGKKKAGKKGKSTAWTRFIKKHSSQRKFRYKSGKLNLRAMGAAYRAQAGKGKKGKKSGKKKGKTRRDFWF